MDNPFDQFDENPFDTFDSPVESEGLEAIPKRMLGVPAQTAIDLGVGTGAFLGGLPYWLIELVRSGDLSSANKAFKATSGYLGERGTANTRITDDPWVQEQTSKITGGIGEGFKWLEDRATDVFQHIEPSATPEQARNVGEAATMWGSLVAPPLISKGIKGIRGTPEPPLIRMPRETPSSGGPWKPGYDRYQTQVQPDLFPETIKEFLPTVEETPIIPKSKPVEPIQPDLFSIPTKTKPETRIFQESGIVDPRYVPPGFFDKSTVLPTVVSPKDTNYSWKDNTSNLLDNLYVRALKTVGGDEKHPLFAGLKRMEADIVLKKSEFDPIRDMWIDAYRGLRGAEKEVLDSILYSKNPSKAREFFNAREKGLGDRLVDSLKGATDTRFKDLAEVFPEIKYNSDFFPRLVKDSAGLTSELVRKGRKKEADKIIKLQDEFDKGNIDLVKFQKGIDDIVLKKWEPTIKTPTSGHAKEREWSSVPKEYQKYYEHPLKALNEYFNETGQTLVERRLLGKGKPEEAISARMAEAQEQGVLTPQQARSFGELLKVRFSPEARRGPGGGMRAAKDIGYASTIGNPLSAAIQVLDVIPAAAKFGVMNTLNAAIKSAMPKFLGRNKLKTMEPASVGLKDIAHDINVSVGNVGKGSVGQRKVAEVANYALDQLLSVTGFKAADRFGKRTIMTAALNKYSKMAKSKRGDKYLEDKGFRNYYKTKEEWASFKEALAKKDVTDPRVREAMVMELLDMQPIAISGMPVSYIKHPQGRILYMLKSWAVRQINTIREANLKGRRMEATKLTGALVLSNMAAPMLRELIKSMWSDQPVEQKDISDRAIGALLRIVFADKYANEFSDVEGMGDLVKMAGKVVKDFPAAIAPPQINMGWLLLNDIGDALNDESKWSSSRYIPITGPYVSSKLKEKE